MQVIEDKTAILMETACRGGAILGNLPREKEEALAGFGYDLGMAFQMTDDVIDYRSDREVMGKNPGKDLEEGKLTLPLITALKSADTDERNRVEALLGHSPIDGEDLRWMRDFLERRGGISETLERSREFLDKATERLAPFPDSEEKRALLKLTDRILKRTY
jgi:octaprenyl-diphosphate synthase